MGESRKGKGLIVSFEADSEHSYNAAYVAWANSAGLAWVNFDDAAAAARGAQTLADAGSAKAFWTDVNAAWKTADVDDAVSSKDYDDALADLTQAFYNEILAPWVAMADACSNASAALRVANAGAKASAVGRWAAIANTPGAAYEAALEAAFAADVGRVAPAEAIRNNEGHAAVKGWYDAVVPAWVTYSKDLTTHGLDQSITMAGSAETYWNAVADANKAYVDGSVPLGIAATYDYGTNWLDWVNDVALADETYGNELADHGVTHTDSVTNAEKAFVNDAISHYVTYATTKTGLHVLVAGAMGEAIINCAGTVAGQLTGTPYTPPASNLTWPDEGGTVNSSGNTVAYGDNGGGGGTGGGGQTTPPPPATPPDYSALAPTLDLSIAFNQGDLASVAADWWNAVWSDYYLNFSVSDPDWKAMMKSVGSYGFLKFDRVVFSGHGSPGDFGCFHWNQFIDIDKKPLQTMTPAKKFFKSLGSHLNPGAHIDIRHCSVAANSFGRKMLTEIAILTGATVHAYTDSYAVSPHGEEWVFTPDGQSQMVKNHGLYTGPASIKPPSK